ncbi:hypothetical protein MMC21_003247, partial [Puttea exsequens]|nr:hypothetical protein [Puttea exsequens]
MASPTGLPKNEIKLMTPHRIFPSPPPPKPIPDIVQPGSTPAERAASRFSLAGRKAI